MSNITKRIIIKKGDGWPTVPASNDHTDGTWITTDIYEAELYQDTSTGNLYSRDSGGIYKINLDYTDFIEDAINNGEVTKAPTENAVFDALALKENSISAGTTSQYYRGDKTFQTLDKSAVGLGNVDNTSDTNKPVSTAQQTALDLKADLESPTFTGNISVSIPTTLTPTGTTEIIDWDNGNGQILSLASATGTVVLTLSNPKAGATYFLKVIQHASTPRDITFPATVKFPGGTAPTISTGASAIDTIVLFFDGTDYFANFSQNYS